MANDLNTLQEIQAVLARASAAEAKVEQLEAELNAQRLHAAQLQMQLSSYERFHAAIAEMAQAQADWDTGCAEYNTLRAYNDAEHWRAAAAEAKAAMTQAQMQVVQVQAGWDAALVRASVAEAKTVQLEVYLNAERSRAFADAAQIGQLQTDLHSERCRAEAAEALCAFYSKNTCHCACSAELRGAKRKATLAWASSIHGCAHQACRTSIGIAGNESPRYVRLMGGGATMTRSARNV